MHSGMEQYRWLIRGLLVHRGIKEHWQRKRRKQGDEDKDREKSDFKENVLLDWTYHKFYAVEL